VISKVKKQSDVGHIFQQSGNLIPQNTFGTWKNVFMFNTFNFLWVQIPLNLGYLILS
jgi:hypothetical protein